MSKKKNSENLEFDERFGLFLSLLEGFGVMCTELGGAKLLTSFYGSSLFVWATVISVTMLALAIGYFSGGISSQKGNSFKRLRVNFITAAILLTLMPLLGNSLFLTFSNASFYSGLILSSLVLLFPSLFIFGRISALLVQILTASTDKNPRVISGRVFALSTVGGVGSAFLCAFFLFPVIGVSATMLLVSATCILLLFWKFFGLFKKPIIFTCAGVFLLSSFLTFKKVSKTKSASFDVAYESEGMGGQLKVVDYKPEDQHFQIRRLLINGIPQTYIVNEPTAWSFWRYPHFIAAYASNTKKDADVLLAGLGGGSVTHELLHFGFKIDVVEMDSRIPALAADYFYLDTSKINIITDDIRHFISRTTKKYDLVVYDVLSGEIQPDYAFTEEALQELRDRLKADGKVIVNFQGTVNESGDNAFKTLYSTFVKAGFNTSYWATNPNDFDDVVFMLNKNPEESFQSPDTSRFRDCCRTHPLIKQFLQRPHSQLNKNDFTKKTLTDNQPMLEYLNRASITKWRMEMMKDIAVKQLKEGLSIYK